MERSNWPGEKVVSLFLAFGESKGNFASQFVLKRLHLLNFDSFRRGRTYSSFFEKKCGNSMHY